MVLPANSPQRTSVRHEAVWVDSLLSSGFDVIHFALSIGRSILMLIKLLRISSRKRSRLFFPRFW
jgi:hypothetical protein